MTLDWLRLLNCQDFGLFPRKMMTAQTKGQIVVASEDEVDELLECADYLDCYIQTHSDGDKQDGTLRLIFMDLDFPGDLRRARTVLGRALAYMKDEYGCMSPYAQFSGAKGYHILQPIKPVKAGAHAKDFLRFMQLKLSRGYCDRQILGDIVRTWRIPGTYNSKGIRAGLDGRVEAVQPWDGQLLDVGVLWAEYRLFKLGEQISAKRKARASKPSLRIEGMRAPIHALMQRASEGQNLTHRQRQALLNEMLAAGKGDAEIMDVFSKLPDFNEGKTQYYIEYARRTGQKPFTSQHLREEAQQ